MRLLKCPVLRSPQEKKSFLLVIQTKFQREMMIKHGNVRPKPAFSVPTAQLSVELISSSRTPKPIFALSAGARDPP
jgi:hypothetical protein